MIKLDLTDQVAVVTGAGGGIGRSVCLALTKAGARVLAVDLSAQQGQETAELAMRNGGDCRFMQADVTDENQVKAFVARALDCWGGRIDIFMNNAGWQGPVMSLIEYPLDQFEKVMAVNVRGVFLGLKHVLAVMRQQGSGAVVNTASLGSYIGTRNLGPYTASKHAVLGLTKTAALEVARKGIRVNAVCPGPVDTDMLRDIELSQSNGEIELLRQKRAASIPDGRYADPDEVAHLMLYLVSPWSSHITGQGVQINGGSHA
jgi:NAD(P)-dependent dehydrogenase (short-subunit alcohol dehydrogenase family)